MAKKKNGEKIAIIDCETDPFDGETMVLPFAWGFFDGRKYKQFWGQECTYELVEYIKNFNGIIYAHNGGKFDFHFLIEYLNLKENLLIINGRIAKCKLGKATLQDSYCILPVPLSAMEKDDFDYTLMRKENREIAENRDKIEVYLKHDCIYLYDKVKRFINEYGYSITLAGAAFNQFKKLYPELEIPRSNKAYYHKFKPFYYGGRVTPFQKGVINGNFKVIDINSAYPYAMLSDHPIGTSMAETASPNKMQLLRSLIHLKCFSKGALPVRNKAGIDFPTGNGEFFITGWEYIAGIDTGTIVNPKIIKAYVFNDTTNFKRYVDKFYKLKAYCGKTGDKVGRLYAKLFLNTLYGKFASNPEAYEEFYIDEYGSKPEEDYKPGYILHDYQLFSKPLPEDKQHFYNLVTAASITGFVRAYLWRAIQQCKNVLYCDTDSIICSDTGKLAIGDDIGEWDVEAKLDKIAIAGKKLYAGWCKDEVIKSACKGVNITHKQILQVAEGETVTYNAMAPSFSVKKPPCFLQRRVKATA